MRPGEIYYLLVPPPAAVGTFIAEHEWLASILVLASLTVLGACIRLLNAFLKDVTRAGGYTAWQKERYTRVEERETARDTELRREESRRMIKLEGKQQRREFKRRMSSWTDQLSLFR
jgi:hypothetical protein